MDAPPPKRRKLNVSWRQERNRLAPVFRDLESTAGDSTSDFDESCSSDDRTVTYRERYHIDKTTEFRHHGETDIDENNHLQLNEEEETYRAPEEIDTDSGCENVESYEIISSGDAESDSSIEDEELRQDESDNAGEEHFDMDSDYYEELLNPALDIDGHKELEQFLGNWVDRFNIPHSASNALLKGLKLLKKQNGTFDKLPLDTRTLLRTPRSVLLDDVAGGRYWHFGLEEGLHQQLSKLPHNSIPKDISILVNIDGLPLTKSSRSTFWPILGLISGEESPFPIGVFHGTGKPECVNSFLEEFADETKKLQEYGLDHRGVNIKFRLSGFICDAPARSFVAGTCGHTGKFACPKCKTVGINFVKPGRKKGRIVYPEMEAALRTHQSFVDREIPDHHKMRTVLEDLNIDMVKDIPLDYMHLVCIGVMRKLLIHWVNRQATQHLITPEMLEEISERLESIRNWVPCEFARLPRSLSDLCRWKATEMRQFLLYTGPVVLEGVLPSPLFRHFLCLHVAIKMLSFEPLCYTQNRYCAPLLKHFVRESAKLYGEHFITFNVHCLIHLPNDVLRFGPLDQFSSFPFENYLQKLKRRIRRSNNPLAQLVKRLRESSNIQTFCRLENTANSVILKQEHRKGPTISIEKTNERQFKVAQCASWKLTCSPPNNFVYLNDNSVFCIGNIVQRSGALYLVGRNVSMISNLYERPLNAANMLNIFVVQLLSHCALSEISISCVKCKAMTIPVDNETDISGSDHDPQSPYNPSFAVFPLLMQDKFR